MSAATTTGAALPDAAYVVALSLLPGCGQQRLRSLLALARPPALWDAICRGRLAECFAGGPMAIPNALARTWRAAANRIDVGEAWQATTGDRAGAWVVDAPSYPAALCDDPDPPPILYWQGDPGALGAGPAVAIVGTRRCTSYGADVARQLGRELAGAGVTVVSGLALGIDGAAHEGALAPAGAAPPVAVVGSGLDVVYPARHRSLWQRVRDTGLLLTEAPFGAAPEPWRFPLRNRIIAGLADVVVVVESHAAGGSMSTVRAAIERGVPVMAVPGSVRSPSSVGTNRLLADGVAPVTDAQDVLVALSLEGRIATAAPTIGDNDDDGGDDDDREGRLDPAAEAVLAAVDWTPTSTEAVLRRTGMALGQASTVLAQLECTGRLVRHGGWWERVG